MPAATGTSTGEVTKTTKTKALPSDTLLTAVLATGAALIVLGFLYARMSSIKLPGGAEITLTEAEKEKTAEKVKEKVEGGKIPPEAAPQVTVAALEELAQKKHWVMANPVATTPHVTDAAVDQAVTSAIETAGL